MNTSKRHNRAARGTPARHRLYAGVFTALLAIGATAPVYAQRSDAPQEYSIQEGSLDAALKQLATQNKLQIAYSPDVVKGKTASGLSGRHTLRAALQQLLQGTGLEWKMVNDSTVVIRKASTKPTERAKPKPRAEPAAQEEEVTNMPAIMVTGTKTLNMDITRTEDDPQPYVVFDREQIERSGATSLEQFLQQRLTMNTSTVNTGESANGATSEIKLRGLSSTQTLILVDGHRMSSTAYSDTGPGVFNQADITGIPLGAIERIEVLPTTASGIYGGSATGGAINIILRRDYTGAEINIAYGSAFNTDPASQKFDITVGHNFNEGKTSILLTANYSDSNDLLSGDRKFSQRAIARMWKNNANWLLPPSGSPPIGAAANISSSDGSNLVLDNGVSLNSAITSAPIGYAGPGTDGGEALIANAGTYNWAMPDTGQWSNRGSGQQRALYKEPSIKSAALVLRHSISNDMEAFLDVSSSRSVTDFPSGGFTSSYLIPADVSTNPFLQDIRVTAPILGSESEQHSVIDHARALIGMIGKLPNRWMLAGDYTWDETTVAHNGPIDVFSLSSAVQTGAIDVLRDMQMYPTDISAYTARSGSVSVRSIMRDLNLRVSGPIGKIAGGSPTLSAAIAYRTEDIPGFSIYSPASNQTRYSPERSQSVASAYIEARFPLFSPSNAITGLRELELQMAVRRDEYVSRSSEVINFPGVPDSKPQMSASSRSNRFSSIDPTLAVRWSPLAGFAMRASYGTGFIPPSLNQLTVSSGSDQTSIGTDPLRGNLPAGPYTHVTGGNIGLEPEQSESISAGVIIMPSIAPGLRVSADYTRIIKTDNIAQPPGGVQGLIDNETIFPGRVIRGPNLPDDPPGWAGPITILDRTYMNLAYARLEAWDIKLDYEKNTNNYGEFDFYFAGTWQPHYITKTFGLSQEVDDVGITFAQPLKFKANAGIVWSFKSWQLGWTVRHFDSYLVSKVESTVLNQGRGGVVPSQTYNDFFVKYDFDRFGSKLVRDMEVQLYVRNIFNKSPPLDMGNAFGGGFYSPFGDPRLSSWQLSIKKSY